MSPMQISGNFKMNICKNAAEFLKQSTEKKKTVYNL